MNDWQNQNHNAEPQQNEDQKQDEQTPDPVVEKPQPRKRRQRRATPKTDNTLSWDDFEAALDFYDRFRNLDDQTKSLFLKGFQYDANATAAGVTKAVAQPVAENDLPGMIEIEKIARFVIEGNPADFIQVANIGSEFSGLGELVQLSAVSFYNALVESRDDLTADSNAEAMTAFAKMLHGFNTYKNDGRGHELLEKITKIEALFENWPNN